MKNIRMRIRLSLPGCIIFATASAQYNYPATKTDPVSETYFGTKVNDPYRWLEHIKNPEVISWFRAQAEFTGKQLAKIPGQDLLMNEMVTFDKAIPEKIIPLTFQNGIYFYKKRKTGEPVDKLYCRKGTSGEEKLLFDPAGYLPGKIMDFTSVVSSDGSRVLLNMSEAGSELGDIRVLNVENANFLEDVIGHSFGEFLDGSNDRIIYYQAKSYDTHDKEVWQNTPAKMHILGKNPGTDILLVSSKKDPGLKLNPAQRPEIYYSRDSRYMILSKASVETDLDLYYAPAPELMSGHIRWKPLSTGKDLIKGFYLKGKFLYAWTAKDNPNFNIVKINLDRPDLNHPEIIITGDKTWKISNVSQAKDYLAVIKSKNEQVFETWTYHFDTGKSGKITTPIVGNVEGTALSKHNNEMLLANYSWIRPFNFYSYNADRKDFSEAPFHMKVDLPSLENLVLEEIEIPSFDGEMVPLSIFYDKTKMKKDGSNPAFMRGYGAYGMSQLPGFMPGILCLLDRGVVIAVAHVRGGGEKGNDWYLAGKKATKPNTWKDLNAIAEYLIRNKYTSPEKLGITGASAGGILIGRAITSRPDLYKVAIPKVGCLNALRMEFSPNGPVNIPEFGTVKNPNDFKALLEMDAYQHIRKGTKYPAQLITTGFNDPRVESYIPAKFAAKMQADNASSNPVFLYVDYKAGHFGGTTIEEKFRQSVQEFAFFLWQTGDPDFQIK
ncbi:prolyl oligopeptidase family serine peptidase [Chryseobacterium hagamense]|uniref:prolyl oligopeptidase n=1 Tax=Chryseobacterium hagamense TaxID=395935 RepID=A0A511YMW8_9FLAO|nr:prolyl oligopeptidase family serine peptidase [Chryseobacterium hagamense]GEN76538.1 prolyl oligopeptidase [Chryseobacterium hagamense]